MGNNRQVLKDNLQTDLQKKIGVAQLILNQLKTAVENAEKNSSETKGDLQQQMDSIQQLLVFRKMELTRQIDLLCHTQINALQEGIRSTYIALGSLQSTLSHLDSFDHSQLINLHVPDFSWMENLSFPPALEAKLDSASLNKEVKQWGSVSAKGFKGLIDVGHTASMPQRFVEYMDSRNEQELMCHKSVASGSSSNINFNVQPKIPVYSVPASEDGGKCNKTVFKIPKDCSSPEKWHVEQWLSEIKTQTCVENDDFEMLSIETCKLQENKVTSSPSEELVINGTNSNDDGESSIVCIEKDESGMNDLSKWLKPKKTSKAAAVVAPLSIVSGLKRNNPLDNRFVDFPCLRQDPNSWIQKKKIKSNLNTELISLSLSQKEIIPPTYALPNPFWLKKYC